MPTAAAWQRCVRSGSISTAASAASQGLVFKLAQLALCRCRCSSAHWQHAQCISAGQHTRCRHSPLLHNLHAGCPSHMGGCSTPYMRTHMVHAVARPASSGSGSTMAVTMPVTAGSGSIQRRAARQQMRLTTHTQTHSRLPQQPMHATASQLAQQPQTCGSCMHWDVSAPRAAAACWPCGC